MRKFVVADLHGCGEVYDSIMGYLDNVSLLEPVDFTINGDLIDRGLDSFRMLQDVEKRMQSSEGVQIHYLGGNHELMMYDALRKRKPGKAIRPFCDWMLNGGWVIEGELDNREDGEELCDHYRDFMGNLSLYRSFEEKVGDKPVFVVHAQAPKKIVDPCPKKISDRDVSVFFMVWTREKDEYGCTHRIGNSSVFTIVGHTPVTRFPGYSYHSRQNYLNIDGGCAAYANGYFDINSVPLVELKDDHLEILIFNHNNEIVQGYYFNGKSTPMTEAELNRHRMFLNTSYSQKEEDVKKKILDALH